MTTYNTGNPVPSGDARDRFDNTQTLDEVVTGSGLTTVTRTGKTIKTLAGQQQDFNTFLVSSGFEPAHLIYAVGSALTVNRPTQLIDYNGSVYRVKMPSTFPVNLTGVWASDSAKLVDVGDSSLRSALASATGSSMIGTSLSPVPGSVSRTLAGKIYDQVSVKDFGALGDGIADDTAAFNAAIAYANSRGGDDYANITGTTIHIPDGRYRITAACTTITRSGVEFRGSSRQGAVLILPVGVYGVFRIGDGGVTASVVGFGFSDVKFEYLTLPDASSAIFLADQAFRIQFTNMLWVNIGVFIQMGTSSSRICGGVTLDNITGSCANVASIPVFDLAWGAGLLMTNVSLFVTGVLNPTHPAPMTSAANRNVFNGVRGFWDTLLCSNCIFERFDYGMVITAASGMVYQNLFFSGNVTFDYIRTTVFQLSASVGGVCSKIKADGWFTSWEGPAISIVGGGYNDNHSFKGEIPIAGQEAVSYAVAGPRMNYFELEIGGVNRVATPSNAAMNFVSTSTGFIVRGCRGNEDNTGAGTPWRAQHGIRILTNADDYMVEGNKMAGSVDAFYIEANGSASKKRRVSNNTQANYADSAGTFTLSSSGTPSYNTTPFVLDIDINGGTVTAIARDGIGITGKTSGVVRLDPGHYVTVTYSVAPSATALVSA